MSDSRFHLKVEFEIYGKKYTWNPSLNYFDRGDGMDDRIFQFFVNSYNDAWMHYQEENDRAARESENRETERREREELARLKAKYERGGD